MNSPKRKTKAKEKAEEALYTTLHHLMRGDVLEDLIRDEVPDEWHILEFDYPVTEKKEKVTLYLDRSVARCFKAMGNGYQARINALLRAWMQMKIGGFLKLEDKMLERYDYYSGFAARKAKEREKKGGYYATEGWGWKGGALVAEQDREGA